MEKGGNNMEIKSTKPLTEKDKLTLERIKKKIEEIVKMNKYNFKNQENNEKLKDWLSK